MAYTIKNTDGSVLVLLADEKVDQTTCSLSLIGRNVNGFGEYYNNNLIQLLGNSANTSGSPPRNPVKGQLWYDTTIKKLKVYDNGFKAVASVAISTTQPEDLSTGDLWFDSVDNQLRLLSGNTIYNIGPAFSKTVGENGWVVTTTTIKTIYNEATSVTVLKNYGNSMGILSHTQFELSYQDANTYFALPMGTGKRVVAGLTLSGDFSYQGKMDEKQLSLYLDLETLGNTISNMPTDVGDPVNFNAQNAAIADILNVMFPPSLGTGGVSYSGYTGMLPLAPYYEGAGQFTETGVPLRSICKVLCRYSEGGKNPDSGGVSSGSGYQIRRFQVTQSGWAPLTHTELSLQY